MDLNQDFSLSFQEFCRAANEVLTSTTFSYKFRISHFQNHFCFSHHKVHFLLSTKKKTDELPWRHTDTLAPDGQGRLRRAYP